MDMKDPDTMTPCELDQAWGRMIGWDYSTGKGFYPTSLWEDWGVHYEWMRGRGWKGSHTDQNDGQVIWAWSKNRGKNRPKVIMAKGPDIRSASLKSGLKAERNHETKAT